MSEFFRSRIDIAHDLIDNKNYQEAVELLQNLKTRIHDTTLLTKITMHDDETEKQYSLRRQNIGTRGGDPWDIYKSALELEKWRAQEYLKYYDLIGIENDL